MMVFQKPPSTE